MTTEALPAIRILNVPNRLVAELSGLLASHQCYPDVQVGHNRMARGGAFVSADDRGGQQLVITLIEQHRAEAWSAGRKTFTWLSVQNTVAAPLGNSTVPAHTTFHLPDDVADAVLARIAAAHGASV